MQNLFGEEIGLTGGKGRHPRVAHAFHRQLLQLHGLAENKKCRNCIHFKYKQLAKKYPKCMLANPSGSAGTDWNGSWQACGKFAQRQT